MTVIAENKLKATPFPRHGPTVYPLAGQVSTGLHPRQHLLALTLGVHVEFEEECLLGGAVRDLIRYLDPRYAIPFQEPRS